MRTEASARSGVAAMKVLFAFAENLRPRQWTKNLILFAGVIFSQSVFLPGTLMRALLACLVFCFTSGAIYVFNDAADVELDRQHPYKRLRPIASGRLPIDVGRRLAAVLIALCLAAAWWLGPTFALVTGVFVLHNFLYTGVLKRMVIMDVCGIAISFVLRAVASVEVLRPLAPEIRLSSWLLLCTFFLSLFLGFAKRRSEWLHVRLLETKATRPVLAGYNEAMLNTLIIITFTMTLMVYTMYTVWPATVEHFGTTKLVLTLPFVFYGMGRYLYLVYRERRGGRPHEILLNDGAIQISVLGWILTVFLIIDLHR